MRETQDKVKHRKFNMKVEMSGENNLVIEGVILMEDHRIKLDLMKTSKLWMEDQICNNKGQE